MHYEIDYSKLPDGERQKKATDDIIAYLGLAKYRQISKLVREDAHMTRKMFIDSLSIMAGIQGYPAEVWADDLNLKKEA